MMIMVMIMIMILIPTMWFHTLYHNTYKDIIYAALKKSID